MNQIVKKTVIIFVTLIVVIFGYSKIYNNLTNSNSNNLGAFVLSALSAKKNNISAPQNISTVIKNKNENVSPNNGEVYVGMLFEDLINQKEFDDTFVSNRIQTLPSRNISSRVLNNQSFSASQLGEYVYFAWPTSFENNGVYSCKATDSNQNPTGDIDCFGSGMSVNLISNTTDLQHRTIKNFVNQSGNIVSYEIYRSHYPIPRGYSVYFSSK